MAQSICSEDGCERPVRARGLCGPAYERLRAAGPLGPLPQRSPQPVRICDVERCDDRAIARGWCDTHYRHWQKHGDPVVPAGRPPRTCTLDGCGRPHQARGLCWPHAERLKKTGVLGGPVADRDYPDICVVPRCGKAMRAKGYCPMHYDRWKKTGHPGPAESSRQPAAGLSCKLEGCPEPRKARGLCIAHYRRERLYGDPGPAQIRKRKPRGIPCEVPGCPDLSHSGGMCAMHYARWWKHGDPGSVEPNFVPGTGHTDRNGYRHIHVGGKSVLEHRHVMSLHLGRPLLRTESVHHKDGNRSRNVINNLELWVSPGRATRGQPPGQRVSDLIAYAVEHHADAVRAELRRADRERRTGQLRLADMPSAHVSEAS